MSTPTAKTVSALARHRPAILAVTAIAAGLIIYTASNNLYASQIPSKDPTGPSIPSLHRSNAQRRRRSHRTRSGEDPGTCIFFRAGEAAAVTNERYYRGQRVFGRYRRYTDNGRYEVLLTPSQLPTAQHIHTEWGVDLEEATSIRQDMEEKLLDHFFAQEMPPGPPIPLSRLAREGFVIEFAAAGQIPAANTEAAIDRYERGDLVDHLCRRRRDSTPGPEEPRPSQLWNPSADRLPPGTPGDLSSTFQIFHDTTPSTSQHGETIADTEDDRSDAAEGEDENKPSQDQNLMNLLYRIAEEQAKKEGFVHRGVTCNSCNAMPIRGIRYRCTNCNDYDLCEQCEALQVHDKTHLFYKIRIPAPFLGNPRQPQPVWYPGKPGRAARSLTTELKMTFSTTTGIQDRQVDAYWEQFQCLAASPYPDDPHGFKVAIGRSSFDQGFVPNITPRPPPPSLVYDRMFAFYDTNGDGLIGFDEFLSGIACIAQGGKELQTRIFRAYDVDNDGFVDRKDFLRMFRAHYALTKELTKQVVSGMDDEFFDEEDARQLIAGSQPISSIFSGPIPSGDPSQPSYGKSENSRGDLVIYDGQGILREDQSDRYEKRYGDSLVADNAVSGHFGSVKTHWLPGIPRLALDVEDDKWPQVWIAPLDVEEALGRRAQPDSIVDRVERSLVMCASQERAEQEYWVREAFRRRTLNNRWQARQFYLDEESTPQPPWAAEGEEAKWHLDLFPENDLCSLRIKALERNEESQRREGFHICIKREVKEKWPDYPNLDGLPERFSSWIRQRYKWHNLAEALAPTRQDIPEATHIVWSLLHSFFDVRRFVIPRRSPDAASDPYESATPSILPDNAREARGESIEGGNDHESCASSPKQGPDAAESPMLEQIQDLKLSTPKERVAEQPDGNDDEKSNSATSVASETIGVPMGKRYGVEEIPEPEVAVGREVMYQVTQESMNELLDPMFKLREDLAVEVMKTKGERELCNDEISEYMRDDFRPKVMGLFQEYQKRWYQNPREFDVLASSQSLAFVEFVLKCLKKQGFPGFDRSNGHIDNAKGTNAANLREATDAIVKLDQAVANEVQGELSSTESEQKQRSSADPANEMPKETVPHYSAVALDLHESVTAFNEADLTAEKSTKEKPLELLLADAGYGIVTPPMKDVERSDPSWVASLDSPHEKADVEDRPDPTLPQHRPDSIAEWETKNGYTQDFAGVADAASELSSIRTISPSPGPASLPPLSEERLLTLALWHVIEEDDKSRGGPGRLDFHDYALIMEGDKGQALGFVGSWVEAAAF
ncbi:MAG: hypothetical protein LQ338_001218 [Usnochroma carphineum]|nr:MAG: hypothetical protein LQ338_001218 [Usnochroma carphineum]